MAWWTAQGTACLGAAVGLAMVGACAVGEGPATTFGPTVVSASGTPTDDGSGSQGDMTGTDGPVETDGTGIGGETEGSDTVGPPCGELMCDAHATCEGGACVCGLGYEGDGETCTDIDGCGGEPCFPGAECIDEPAPAEGFMCGACPAGYEGDGESCSDIDGCVGDPCFPGVACEDVVAPGEGFMCGACPAGYEGDGESCSDIDGCVGGPCYPGVVCSDLPAPELGFSCGDCPPGTFGDGLDCVIASVYEIGDNNNSGTLGPYFRANGYVANGDGWLSEFEVYLGLSGACNLDFYVLESAAPGGALTQLWRNTVAAGAGTSFRSSGTVDIPITNGMYYALGVGWNCAATYYWNNTGTWSGFDAGVGNFNNTRWDNAYPGASDMYLPPNTGGGTTTYRQRIYYAE